MTLRFSLQEKQDLVQSWLVVSAAFLIVVFGLRGFLDLGAVLGALLLVGTGFIIHELAHKITALHYGCSAEYVAQYGTFPLTLLFAFFGVLFAAPGAVVIRGFISLRQNGIIALAGPLSNVVLALCFLMLALTNPLGSFIFTLGSLGAQINAFLAAFNMLPFGPFDGAKVFAWSKTACIGTICGAGFLLLSLDF